MPNAEIRKFPEVPGMQLATVETMKLEESEIQQIAKRLSAQFGDDKQPVTVSPDYWQVSGESLPKVRGVFNGLLAIIRGTALVSTYQKVGIVETSVIGVETDSKEEPEAPTQFTGSIACYSLFSDQASLEALRQQIICNVNTTLENVQSPYRL
jgi:hypothetical protein